MYRIPQLLEKPHYSSTTRSPELCCLFLWHKAALLSGKDSTMFQANTAWLCKNVTWKTRMKNHEMLQDWYLGSNPPDATRICLGTMKTWAVSESVLKSRHKTSRWVSPAPTETNAARCKAAAAVVQHGSISDFGGRWKILMMLSVYMGPKILNAGLTPGASCSSVIRTGG